MQKPKQIDESEKVGMVHNAGLFPLSTKSNYFLKLNSVKTIYCPQLNCEWYAISIGLNEIVSMWIVGIANVYDLFYICTPY